MLRRSLLFHALIPLVPASALAQAAGQSPVPAHGDPAQAAAFIRQAGGELAATIGGPGGVDEKRRRLEPFLRRVVDVDGVGRFVLGRFWTMATPPQRQAYLALFHRVLANSVAGRLGEYDGGHVGIEVGRPEVRADGILVPTTVTRPNNKPFDVAWLVTADAGGYRIADVVAEGMSLRLAQRSDYTSFLTRNNNDVDALIRALEAQVGRGAGLR